MFMILDIIGGFMQCVIAMIGYYCLRENSLDMQCLLTWGMVSGVQGVLDFVLRIDQAVKMGFIFSSSMSPAMNCAFAVLWSGPIVMVGCTSWFLGSCLSLTFFQQLLKNS